MTPNRIVELAAIIYDQTKKVDAYLIAQNLLTPSFDVSYPAVRPLPTAVQDSQETVLEASDELTALFLGPARSIIKPVRTTISCCRTSNSLQTCSTTRGQACKPSTDLVLPLASQSRKPLPLPTSHRHVLSQNPTLVGFYAML